LYILAPGAEYHNAHQNATLFPSLSRKHAMTTATAMQNYAKIIAETCIISISSMITMK